MLKIRTLLHTFFLLIFVSAALISSVSAGQPNEKKAVIGNEEAATRIEAWEKRLEAMGRRVDTGYVGSLEARDIRQEIEQIFVKTAEIHQHFTGQIKEVRVLLDALGPAPDKEKEGVEDPLKKQRQEFLDKLAVYEGQIKRIGLLITRGEQILVNLGKLSRALLKETLLGKTVSPLSPDVWKVAGPELTRLLEVSLIQETGDWLRVISSNKEKYYSAVALLAVALLALCAGWPLRLWALKHYGRNPLLEHPSFTHRIFAGLVESCATVLSPLLFIFVIWSFMGQVAELSLPLAGVVNGVAKNLALFLFGYGLIRAVFATNVPAWNVTFFSEHASRVFAVWLMATLVVFTVLDGVYSVISWATPSAELDSAFAFIFTLSLSPLLIFLLTTSAWRDRSSETEMPDPSLPRLRSLLALVLAVVPVVAVAGYPNLATYLIRAVFMTGFLIAALFLLRTIFRELGALLLDKDRPFGKKAREALALDDEGCARFLFWGYAFSDLLLLVLGGIALLPIWGLGLEETLASIFRVFRGVEIGEYTFSLLDIFLGLALFAFFIFLTRLLQGGLDKHVLPNLTKDRGVRDALKTGVGYIGTIIAAFIGLSALGLDLTNLALIAGALSVGLGFGLQNIVNNFVSGLILLAERPIKPGDWIVIGSNEGTVKRVNVRSTEIETFQRASVIIPNADLISNSVINWTHKNLVGRIDIPVGVAYGSDVLLVKKILNDCVTENPNVLEKPPPVVLFMNFGESSLDFELRAYLSDVSQRYLVASDLRFAIYEALNRNGVEIPFPQRVVHLVGKSGPGDL